MARVQLLLVSLMTLNVHCEYYQPVNSKGKSRFDLSTLKFVSVIARHGSRSPLGTFPTDRYPYTDSRYWPDGVGRLTKAGKKQAYELGKQLKSRYNGFISPGYSDSEALFLSNAMDRDLASSQLMAAGMYPPSEADMFDSDLRWQPISVWVTDYDVVDTNNNCPKFIVEVEKALNELYQEMFIPYESLFVRISNFTGLQLSDVWSNLYTVWQMPLLRKENGLPDIAWEDTNFRDQLFYPCAKRYQVEVVGTSTMINLIAGPVLEPLVLQLNNKAQGTLSPDRKVFVLAAHDTTIVAAVGGLGIDELLIPDSASYLVFELHGSVEGDIVQVLFFNHSSTGQPTLFEIPDCRHPCPLAKFTQVAQRTVANSGRENCVVDRNSMAYSNSGSPKLYSASFFINLTILTVIFSMM